jgi:hypothetical protein
MRNDSHIERYIPPPRVHEERYEDRVQPPRQRDEEYGQGGREKERGMMADRVEERLPPPRIRASAEDLWERGRDVEELAVSSIPDNS